MFATMIHVCMPRLSTPPDSNGWVADPVSFRVGARRAVQIFAFSISQQDRHLERTFRGLPSHSPGQAHA
jgi:hypothetical protein